ncbi:MAG TPA: DinB family protein [Candidatus Acidoferrales bacterium]|nr:DinB family protein [Candidatus Acidoferrales bacterium]
MVPMVEPIYNEFREEMPATRRLLERVPADKLAWKPHPKSRSLGELATHVANIPGMVERIANQDEFAPGSIAPGTMNSVEEIRAAFEKNARAGEEILSNMTEKTATGSWRLVFKGKEIFKKPRVAVLRTNVLNHLYHHRGQLGVYLRLLDVPVPVVYGPTADENPFF